MSRPRRARKSVPDSTRPECSATPVMSMLFRSATGWARVPQVGGRRSSSACKLMVGMAYLHLLLCSKWSILLDCGQVNAGRSFSPWPGLFCYTGNRFWAIGSRGCSFRWGAFWPMMDFNKLPGLSYTVTNPRGRFIVAWGGIWQWRRSIHRCQ